MNKKKYYVPEWAIPLCYVDPSEIEKTKYSKTIKRRTWVRSKTDKRCFKREPETILQDPEFKKELWWESNGKFRKHDIKLNDYQIALKEDFMKHNIVALLSIKLPSKSNCGYARTQDFTESLKMYRKILREIQRACVGRSHWEKKPGFDFIFVIEKGQERIWHCHIGIIAPPEQPKYWKMPALEEACETVREKFQFGKNVIDFRYVYDKEGVCMYLVKELKFDRKDYLQEADIPMYYTMETLFHVSFEKKPKESEEERKERQKKRGKFKELIGMIKTAFDKKKKGILNIPNPINKLAGRIYRIFRK